MCVIVYKPENTAFPDYDTLRLCWKRNSDGAGYMFPYNNKVIIRKGFMEFSDLLISLCKDINITGNKIPYVIHFRITTQGGVKPELTHPYPLSRDMGNLKLLQSECEMGVAHNGIISLTKSYTTDHNDTMEFITNYLSLLIKNDKYFEDEDTLTLIKRLCGSKLCILNADSHVEMIGEFFKDGDCYYSNLSHKPVTTTTYTSSTTTKKDDDDDDDDDRDEYKPGEIRYKEFLLYFKDSKDFNEDGRYNFIPNRFCPALLCKETGYCGNCKYAEFCKKEGYYDKVRHK